MNEDGAVDIFREKKVKLDGRIYYSPNERIMRRLGYKPLIISPSPKLEDKEYLYVTYIDRGDMIETEYKVIGGT